MAWTSPFLSLRRVVAGVGADIGAIAAAQIRRVDPRVAQQLPGNPVVGPYAGRSAMRRSVGSGPGDVGSRSTR
jgi:hypothetical protein